VSARLSFSADSQTTDERPLARVEITLARRGEASRVVIDGVDYSRQVQSVAIKGSAHSLPLVELLMIPAEVTIKADAEIVASCAVCSGRMARSKTATPVGRGVKG